MPENSVSTSPAVPVLDDANPSRRFLRPFPLALLLAFVFFILALPLLPLYSRYRGDEGLYTNAAMRMVNTGDYLTPYWADGKPRFNKPVLNYWLVAADFKI